MRKLVFRCSSVTNTGILTKLQIEEIKDRAVEITRGTFRRKISMMHLRSLEKELGYEVNKRSGMTMKDDGYVRYFSSKFDNGVELVPVYYIYHSSIEYFFT